MSGGTPRAVRVRAAGVGDAELLASFNLAMAEETEDRGLVPEVVRRGVQAILEDPAKGDYFVAEREGVTVGCLLLTREWSDWRNAFFWWIQSVYVVPEARGAGVFRALYDHVVARGRGAPDVCGVRLYVERENERAQAVYRSCGMHETAYRLFELEFREEERT